MSGDQVGRLAMRVRGTVWVAYYARRDSMHGAIFLGSIQMAFVEGNPTRKMAFMALMQEAVSDFLKESTGGKVSWPNPPQEAPLHERGENG